NRSTGRRPTCSVRGASPRRARGETSPPLGGSSLRGKLPILFIGYYRYRRIWHGGARSNVVHRSWGLAGLASGHLVTAREAIERGPTVIRKLCTPFRLLLSTVLALGLIGVAVVPGQSEEKGLGRAQQIADLEKQIHELNRRLAELRKGPNGTNG